MPVADLVADVFVAGGGPAGLAAAIAVAQRGFSVMLADAGRAPIDKACGEGIMPEGVEALGALGVDLRALPAARLEGIRFVDESGECCARFPKGAGLGVRRTTLHAALAARAEDVGARLAWGMRVERVGQGEAAAGGRTIRCRYAVCADGLHSALRRMAGLEAGTLSRRRYGFRRHYRLRPWSPFVEVYWAGCGQAYVTPVGAGEICVALLTSDAHARLESALPAFPALQEKLRDALRGQGCAEGGGANVGDSLETQALAARSLGGVTAVRRLVAVTRGRIALVGDASGSADAITGDGLSLAFRQATALAEALASGDLSRYQRAHEQISHLPRRMGELLLLLDRHPRLRRRVFAAFAQSPEIFARLLALHTGGNAPRPLAVKDCLRFGWSLLAA